MPKKPKPDATGQLYTFDPIINVVSWHTCFECDDLFMIGLAQVTVNGMPMQPHVFVLRKSNLITTSVYATYSNIFGIKPPELFTSWKDDEL